MTLHPQRCETCNFNLSLFDEVDTCKGDGLTNGEWVAYRKRGCASHSSQQSGRDKVLDELMELIREDLKQDFDEELYITHQDLLWCVSELRSTKGDSP